MVLSFLVLSILIVMLICSCYGLCKLPCKRTVPRDRERRAHPHRSRPMIPLPSPGPATVKSSTSSTFQQNSHKSGSVVNQQAVARFPSGRHHHRLPESFTDGGDRRRDSLSPTRYSAPPSAASNVIHLSQLPSLSCHSDLEQFAQANATPHGKQPGRQPPHPHQSRYGYQQKSSTELNQKSSRNQTFSNANSVSPMAAGTSNPPSHQAKPADVSPPYPGMGYPYRPCKSPQAAHEADLSHSQLHSRRTASRHHHHHHQVGAGDSLKSGAESELTTDIDTMTEGETNSVVSGRTRHIEVTTTPPAYSTEV